MGLSVPSRFEPLQQAFGDSSLPNILLRVEQDLQAFARLSIAVRTARQGKLVFLLGTPGSGKSTAGYSLPIFLPEYFAAQHRVPPPWVLPHERIAEHIAAVPVAGGITTVTIDGREAPAITPDVFRTVLMQLNGLLRHRPDLMLIWPVNSEDFAEEASTAMRQFGGQSAFVSNPILHLAGVDRSQFRTVLERMLNVAGWDLAEAAVTWQEVDELAATAENVGTFLDHVQNLVTQRTNLESLGVTLPVVVFAFSSDNPALQDICRGLRRADTYYVEAARLLMETRESNVAEWWKQRQTDPRTALPFIVQAFQAQVVAISPGAVVYACLMHGDGSLQALAAGLQPNSGNARSAMNSTELARYFGGIRDFKRWGGQKPSQVTLDAYAKIQAVSKERHRDINAAVLSLAVDAGVPLSNIQLEQKVTANGLMADATLSSGAVAYTVEFHHKSLDECTPNKVAIYVLDKLREYAIDFSLATR